MDCVAYCFREFCCRSANFKKSSKNPFNDDKENCELLHAVAKEEPENLLKRNDNYDHLVLGRDEPYNCICLPCKNGGNCNGISKKCSCSPGYNGTKCENGPCAAPKPLGMESGKISDAQITASTTYSGSYLPQNARLNKHLGTCAWATKSGGQVGSWHQVDFGYITHVTGVATQGNCMNIERVKSYMISYSMNNTKWTQYRESGTSKIFTANSDQTTIVTHSFKPPILARYVRLLPQTWNSYPGLRVEYYGCSSEN